MKPRMAIGMVVVTTALALPLSAQWPAFRTPGVPRTATGAPNLEAPAPRTADGKPDISGVWQYTRRPGLPEPGRGALGQPRTGTSQFWDISTGLKEPIPFQPWAKELLQKRLAEESKDNPDAHCLPLGIVQQHSHGDPRRFVQTPGLITMIYEANSGLRQIYTDGRRLPTPADDPQPWYHGYSVGRWDGDTLVVETTGLRDDGWLDVSGTPLTSGGKVTERFRRPNFGTLDIDITIDDPKAYTTPWTVQVRNQIMADTVLFEFICQENEKSSHLF